jgi:hypothetical protein
MTIAIPPPRTKPSKINNATAIISHGSITFFYQTFCAAQPREKNLPGRRI